MLRKLGFSVPVAAGIIVALNASASAGFNPYGSGTTGYDYSYVQCGSAAPAASFGIVGVNAGYPFTYYNSCLAAEYAAAIATGNGAVYMNTGYDPTYTAIDVFTRLRPAPAPPSQSPSRILSRRPGPWDAARRSAIWLTRQRIPRRRQPRGGWTWRQPTAGRQAT